MIELAASGWSIFMTVFLLVFGLCTLLAGVGMAALTEKKSRMLGFLVALLGWASLFALYLWFWDSTIVFVGIVVLGSMVLGIAATAMLLLGIVIKSS